MLSVGSKTVTKTQRWPPCDYWLQLYDVTSITARRVDHFQSLGDCKHKKYQQVKCPHAAMPIVLLLLTNYPSINQGMFVTRRSSLHSLHQDRSIACNMRMTASLAIRDAHAHIDIPTIYKCNEMSVLIRRLQSLLLYHVVSYPLIRLLTNAIMFTLKQVLCRAL